MKSDLIERQAAIDALEKAMCEDGFRSATGLIHKTTAYDIIRHLPAAQPEIIRCKDCKLYGDAKCLMNFDGYDWAEPEGYCQAAERRAKKKWMT